MNSSDERLVLVRKIQLQEVSRDRNKRNFMTNFILYAIRFKEFVILMRLPMNRLEKQFHLQRNLNSKNL